MKSFYFIFALCVFGVFALLEYRGVSMDSNSRTASPQYYSYRGGGSSRSGGGGGTYVGFSSK